MDRMSSLITVSAKPEPVSFDPSRSAVIVVDMQNDFGSEGGMFALGGIDISRIRGVIPTSGPPPVRSTPRFHKPGLPLIRILENSGLSAVCSQPAI